MAAVVTLVQTKRIRINIHKRNITKNTVQTIQNTINTSKHITKTPTHYKIHTHTHTHTHITKPTHTHTHTHITKLSHTHTHITKSTHIHTPTHYKIHTHTHTHTHTFPYACINAIYTLMWWINKCTSVKYALTYIIYYLHFSVVSATIGWVL